MRPADTDTRSSILVQKTFVVGTPPMPEPLYPPEILSAPETLRPKKHAWQFFPSMMVAPELPPQDISPADRIRWLSGHADKDLKNEAAVGRQTFYNRELLAILSDNRLSPKPQLAEECARESEHFVNGFIGSFVSFQKAQEHSDFDSDKGEVPIDLVVDFRENTTAFFLDLNERGLLTQAQKDKLLAEGKLPVDLIARQRQTNRVFESARGRRSPRSSRDDGRECL